MGRAATHPVVSRKGSGANQTERDGAIRDASVAVMQRLPGAAERNARGSQSRQVLRGPSVVMVVSLHCVSQAQPACDART